MNRRLRSRLAARFAGIALLCSHSLCATARAAPVENQKSKVDLLRAEAGRALDDGVPDVAVEKFRRCLAMAPADDARAPLALQLARALLDARRASEALDTLQNANARDLDASLVKAQALAALYRWSEALPLFEKAAAQRGLAASAKLGMAESLHALNRTPEAITLLESLAETGGVPAQLRLAEFYIEQKQLDKCAAILKTVAPVSGMEKKWAACVGGRLLLASGHAAEALPLFRQAIQSPQGVPESLLAAATLGIADATLALNGPEQADNVIEDYLWHYSHSAWIDPMFRRLDQIYARERNPSESELQKWMDQGPRRRASIAQFYLARLQLREKKRDAALLNFEAFASRYPDHAMVPEALLAAGKIHFEERRGTAALKNFEAAMRQSTDKELLGEIEIAAGAAHFMLREFVIAANLFHDAAQHAPKLGEIALFNSALAWLYQGNYDRFLDDYKELSARFQESEMRRDLILEEGLLQARAGDRRAEKTLKLFLRDFPEHRRVSEARLALAEIAFQASPRNLAAAGGYMKAAYEAPHTEADSDRAAYLAIFLADAAAPRDEQKVIALCRSFIGQRATSKLQPEVRMKLGQVYFRREDFASAQLQFETLANAGSPFAEAALFLAGQSAMKTMNPASLDHAIELFESVAQRNGSLKLYARQEQAIAKSRAGKESEALILYNDILGANPDDELKFSVLCGKGDALAVMGGSDAKFFGQAIAVYDDLGGQSRVPAHWRNQALYKKGKCLEKLARKGEALTAFYDALEPQAVAAGSPEYFWYYKAGFDAARLLEAQQQWKSAIGIYQKMANLEGPRAQEVRTRLGQLRLEHFIWEE